MRDKRTQTLPVEKGLMRTAFRLNMYLFLKKTKAFLGFRFLYKLLSLYVVETH